MTWQNRRAGHAIAPWICLIVLGCVTWSHAQNEGGAPKPSAAKGEAPSGTSTDLFVGIGSDFDRPGLPARANYGIGIGHTFGFLKKDPIGDELTFGYTYENAGTHGFLHTDFGEHTEYVGMMKNFALPKDEAGLRLYLDSGRDHKLHRQCQRAKPIR
jgi:hypothetical protein